MRDTLRALGLFLGMVALTLGCAKDKYHMRPTFPEAYTEPPNESRYNEPDKAGYRKPLAPAKEEKTAFGRTGPGGGGPGGF
jgi:hypothetical protein